MAEWVIDPASLCEESNISLATRLPCFHGNQTSRENEDCPVCKEVTNLTREWYIVQLLLPVLTFVANFVTCYALIRARGMKFYLRVIFLNLNITDLMSSLAYLYHLVFAWNSFEMNVECIIRYVIYVSMFIVTQLMICFLSMDRLWSIVHPFSYQRYAGTVYVLGAIGLIWVINFVYVTIGFSFMPPVVEGCFYPLLLRAEIHFLYSIASFCVITLIICLNTTMYIYARIQISKIAQTMVGQAREEFTVRSNLKSTVTTLCVVIPFVLCNTPSYGLMFYFGLNTPFTKTSQALYSVNALTTLTFINSLLNPFIYVWRSRQIREVLIGTLPTSSRRTSAMTSD